MNELRRNMIAPDPIEESGKFNKLDNAIEPPSAGLGPRVQLKPTEFSDSARWETRTRETSPPRRLLLPFLPPSTILDPRPPLACRSLRYHKNEETDNNKNNKKKLSTVWAS